MTAATVPARTTVPTRVLTWRVLKMLWQVTHQVILGYLLVMIVTFSLVGVGFAIFGQIEQSVWDWAAQSPKYFNVAVGIMITPAALTVLVAHGVTRRVFAVAGSIFLAAVALGMGLVWAVAYLVEHAIYAAADWPQVLSTTHLFHSPTQSWAVVGEYFLLVFAHQTTGWLLGTSFTRYGWWGGITFMPVALLPAVAAELLLLTQWVGKVLIEDAGWQRIPLPLAVPGVLLACAAGLYLNYLLLRQIRLKPTRG